MKALETPIPGELSVPFEKLSAAATALNAASDELGEVVGALEAALKRLNLGIEAWTDISHEFHEDSEYYRTEQVGYARARKQWGISLRVLSGHYGEPESEREDRWSFSDAPRDLRIDGIEKLPNLLEELTQEAAKVTSQIQERAEYARQLAATIDVHGDSSKKRRKSE